MNMAEFPFTFEKVDGEYSGAQLVKTIPGNFVCTTHYMDELPKVYNLDVRPDDIWEMGLIKSGTTWLGELIWGVYHEGDLTEAKSKYHLDRWIIPEMNGIRKFGNFGKELRPHVETHAEPADYLERDSIETLKSLTTKRFIRSHLPLFLLPPKLLDTCKVIYIARNFKDTWVSVYHFFTGSVYDTGKTFEDIVEDYLTDLSYFCPYAQHVRLAYEKRHHKNMLFLLYEDLKKDLPGVVRKVAKFLDKKLTDKQVDNLVDYLSVDNMRKNKFANMDDTRAIGWLDRDKQFVRKGVVGDWKNYFTPELLDKYNKWWNKHMQDCDFKFPED